jgi:hypothetical protein
MGRIHCLADLSEKIRTDIEKAKTSEIEVLALENLSLLCKALQDRREFIVSSDIKQKPCAMCGLQSTTVLREQLAFDDDESEEEPRVAYVCDQHAKVVFDGLQNDHRVTSTLFQVAQRLGVHKIEDILPALAALTERHPVTQVKVSDALRTKKTGRK